jgi:hypothetical protein
MIAGYYCVKTSFIWDKYQRTSHWEYREIHLCSFCLKIYMLVDFEVLNNVLMDLKPLARLLDPHSGHKGHDREKSTSVRFG